MSGYIIRHAGFGLSEAGAYCVSGYQVLENHVFLDPEIARSIAARDILNRRCKISRILQLCTNKQFLHRGSSSRVFGRKKYSPHEDYQRDGLSQWLASYLRARLNLFWHVIRRNPFNYGLRCLIKDDTKSSDF